VISTYARTAFASGYAEAGEEAFPIPPHVAGELRAAMEAAAENDHPAVLEEVRRSGRQAGLYAAMQSRIDALERRWRAKLRPVLRQVGHLIAPKIAHAVRGRQEADASGDARQIVQDAIDALRDLGIWQEWRGITRQAMAEGLAEGAAAGNAWLSHTAGAAIPSFELEFPEQLQALRDLGGLPGWDAVDTWQGKQVQGLAYQLGNELADAQAQGASVDDMLGLVESTISGDTSYAYLMLDNAIGASTIQGRLGVYGGEGVTNVDLMISPEACPTCEALATGNPYPIASAPEVPVHPRCRCDLVPEM
jgi:hypothetical protein